MLAVLVDKRVQVRGRVTDRLSQRGAKDAPQKSRRTMQMLRDVFYSAEAGSEACKKKPASVIIFVAGDAFALVAHMRSWRRRGRRWRLLTPDVARVASSIDMVGVGLVIAVGLAVVEEGVRRESPAVIVIATHALVVDTDVRRRRWRGWLRR